MLMTALTTVTNPATGKNWRCRVLLDSACDSSFIEEDLAQKLGLNMEPLPVSNVGGFGGHTTKVQTNGVKFMLGGVSVKAKPQSQYVDPLQNKVLLKMK